MKIEVFFEYSWVTPAPCIVLYHGVVGEPLTEIVSDDSVLLVSLKQKTGLMLTVH